MDKKVIVITGATGGLGRELVSFFDRPEHHLLLFKNRSDAYAVQCSHEWIQLDFLDSNAVVSYLETEFVHLYRVDVLINNAGISRNGVSWKLGLEDWNDVIQINLTVPFLMAQASLKKMKQQKSGRIINISSVVAQTGVIGTSAYAASKSGLLGLTKTMAKESASFGVTVNALALGYFDRGMIKEVNAELQNRIKEQIPVGKLGDVQTIADTIEWLMLPSSEYVTGQTISLNGGLFC